MLQAETNPADLPRTLEAVVARPDALPAEVHRMTAIAMQRRLPAVCVTPVYVQRVAVMVRPAPVPVCALVGYPHGTSKSTIKAIEATSAAKDGADEIEVTPHLPHLVRGDIDSVRGELMEIVRAARATGRDVMVRVALHDVLTTPPAEAALAAGLRAIRESGCDMAVIHTPELIPLLRRIDPQMPIKLLAAPADIEHARNLLTSGADRVGIESADLLEQLFTS